MKNFRNSARPTLLRGYYKYCSYGYLLDYVFKVPAFLPNRFNSSATSPGHAATIGVRARNYLKSKPRTNEEPDNYLALAYGVRN